VHRGCYAIHQYHVRDGQGSEADEDHLQHGLIERDVAGTYGEGSNSSGPRDQGEDDRWFGDLESLQCLPKDV